MWWILLVVILLVGYIWAGTGMTTRRKMAIASWSTPNEGLIHAKMVLDCTAVLKFMERKREAHVTMTTVVGKMLGVCLRKVKDLNGRIVLGRFIPKRTCDVGFLVQVQDGVNLAYLKVKSCDAKSVEEIAQDMLPRARRIRDGKDTAVNKSMALSVLPTWLLSPAIKLVCMLSNGFGVSIPPVGVNAFAFGSAVVTSVGMMGIDEAWAPLTPYLYTPIILLVGAVKKTPVVIDGQVAVHDCVTLCGTIDHRYIDGYQGAQLCQLIRDMFERPELLEDAAYLQQPLRSVAKTDSFSPGPQPRKDD